MAAIKSD